MKQHEELNRKLKALTRAFQDLSLSPDRAQQDAWAIQDEALAAGRDALAGSGLQAALQRATVQARRFSDSLSGL